MPLKGTGMWYCSQLPSNLVPLFSINNIRLVLSSSGLSFLRPNSSWVLQSSLTRCSVILVREIFMYLYFNSCTPCGMQHQRHSQCFLLAYFNSCTPCGMQPRSDEHRIRSFYFNSCTPCGMQRSTLSIFLSIGLFQFMHPLRDATLVYRGCLLMLLEFQFMHPLRDATKKGLR